MSLNDQKPASPQPASPQPASPNASGTPAQRPANPSANPTPGANPAVPPSSSAPASVPASVPANPPANPPAQAPVQPSAPPSAPPSASPLPRITPLGNAPVPAQPVAQSSAQPSANSPAQASAQATPRAATAGQTCPVCGSINRVGVLICENCGADLATGQSVVPSTRQFTKSALADETAVVEAPPSVPSSPQPIITVDLTSAAPAENAPLPGTGDLKLPGEADVPQTASLNAAAVAPTATPGNLPGSAPVTMPPSPALSPEAAQQAARDAARKSGNITAYMVDAVMTAGTDVFDDTMLLRLEIEGSNTPVVFQPKAETSLGRRDPATGTMPDVDLTAYAGYRMGVSRKHAIIRRRGSILEIYDLGSSNGTHINGTRLTAHQPAILRDGDVILLGKMTIRALFQLNRRSTQPQV